MLSPTVYSDAPHWLCAGRLFVFACSRTRRDAAGLLLWWPGRREGGTRESKRRSLEPGRRNGGTRQRAYRTVARISGLFCGPGSSIALFFLPIPCSGFPVPPLLFFRVPGSAFALFPGSWFLVPGSAVSSPRLQPQVFGAFAKAFEELGLIDDLHAKRAGLVGLGAWVRAD